MRHHRSTRFASVSLALVLLTLARVSPADDPKKPQGPANRLAKETSPYLLLHAHNPVDWYPWGPEAFAKAKAENKPIFLSVGYSSCYWCHVMERESFMDPEIAKAINAGFVAIKVDREERPDVDQIYMTAVQLFNNGGGGWPMSVFMTPDGRPFFGGTYFKPADFAGLLKAVGDAWRDQRAAIEKDAENLSDAVRKSSGGSSRIDARVPLTRELAAGGRAALADQFDPDFGGFGFDPARPKRPKFPEPVNLLYLLDQHRRDVANKVDKPSPDPLAMALKTLDAMARGGIRDHLAGGYHRYSTVRDWSIPHFEKMLYDNAQLAETLVLAFEITRDPRWKAEAEATLAFVARTMTGPDGLFSSALDAESEGVEGKSYLWTPGEVAKVFGNKSDYDFFAPFYALDGEPDLEDGHYVLLMPRVITDPKVEARLATLRAKLLAERNRRPAPALDDKVLTSWNALMIAAYAEAGRVFQNDPYKAIAGKAADALLRLMTGPDGRLLRTARGGKAKLAAYLEDYAFLTQALLRVHAATGDPLRLAQAKSLADRMIGDFADRKDGGFFYTAGDHEALIARVKDPFDNAVPGANSQAIRALVGLGVASGDGKYLDEAARALEAFAPSLKQRPAGSPLMLLALEEYLDARASTDGKTAESPSRPLPGAPGVVTARAVLSRASAAIAPGDEFEVELALTIKEKFHLYANPASSEEVIPTVISLAPGSVGSLVEVRYPPGESKTLEANGPLPVSIYEKKAVATVRLKLPDDARAGAATARLRVRYQACDDRACQAPAILDVPVSFEIKGK